MKIAITGDLHLDNSKVGRINPKTDLDVRVEDFLNAFDFVIEKATKNNTDIFVLNGDLLKHRSTTPQIETIIAEKLKTIADRMKLIIVLGNHDYTSRSLAYGVHTYSIIEKLKVENVEILTTLHHKIYDDVDIVFYPYYDYKTRQFENNQQIIDFLTQSVSEFEFKNHKRIFIGHGTPEGTIFNQRTTELLNIDEPVIPKRLLEDNFDYSFFSHIHKSHYIGNKIFHIGSIEKVDFGEADHQKGFIIYDTNNNNFQFVKIPTRNMYNLKIDLLNNDNDPTKTIIDKLDNIDNFQQSIIKVEITCSEKNKQLIDKQIIKHKLQQAFHSIPVSWEITDKTDRQIVRCEGLSKDSSDSEILQRVLDSKKDLSPEDKQRLLVYGNAILIQAKDSE